jgi:glycosyltransferase involved in cell wall biosynthesis
VSRPLISVLIPSYNHAKYLREAVESVWSQSYANIELVIVDDASTDDSRILLETLRAESPIPMRLEFNERNKGPAFTIGRAFELSTGELIAFLASDDVYAPSRFEAQVQRFKDDAELFLTFGDAVELHADNTHGAHIHGKKVRELLIRPPKEILEYLYTHVSPLQIQCALVKKSLLLDSDAFDPSALADDWLINIKMFELLARHGNCAFVDQVVCYYRIHPENLHKNTTRQRALNEEVIERYTPANLRRLGRSNIYWHNGLLIAKTEPLKSLKYFYLSQLNRFRPWLLLDLARRIFWAPCKKLMRGSR